MLCSERTDIYQSAPAGWQWSTVTLLFKQGKRTSLPIPKTSCFPFLQVFHSLPQPFCFLHDRLSAKAWNIYEGVRDGTPFQDLPLWLWIRAFSSALNNSCSESICLVRFSFSYLMYVMDKSSQPLFQRIRGTEWPRGSSSDQGTCIWIQNKCLSFAGSKRV